MLDREMIQKYNGWGDPGDDEPYGNNTYYIWNGQQWVLRYPYTEDTRAMRGKYHNYVDPLMARPCQF